MISKWNYIHILSDQYSSLYQISLSEVASASDANSSIRLLLFILFRLFRARSYILTNKFIKFQYLSLFLEYIWSPKKDKHGFIYIYSNARKTSFLHFLGGKMEKCCFKWFEFDTIFWHLGTCLNMKKLMSKSQKDKTNVPRSRI